MAKKASNGNVTEPKFPYTTQPAALRSLLKAIPGKPRPAKVNRELLSSWDVTKNNNGASATIGVLKKVGLLDGSGVPTPAYTDFMSAGTGAKILAQKIRDTYPKFFEAHHAPHKEPDAALRSLLNIHSGGGDDALRYQLQTFKALCEHADFDGAPSLNGSVPSTATTTITSQVTQAPNGTALPSVNIALHIHLPENKTGRDYTAMIEDIGRFIFGREVANEQR